MLPRDRIRAALDFQPSDIAPLECHPSTAGLYEHGARLQELFRLHPHDFGDSSNLPLPQPDPEKIQPDGSYRDTSTDAWGVQWQHCLYAAWGIPEQRPLDDLANLATYRPPTPPSPSGPDFEAAKASVAKHKERYYYKGGGGAFFEILRAVRRYEDVMMDIALNTREINQIADMIVEYEAEVVRYSLALEPDGIQGGDDFGGQDALLMSREHWLRFCKPRYERLLAPVREAGRDIFFHSCGQIWDLLPDLADLGCSAIWPQINLYDWPALAQRCRDLHLAIALHPERSHTMTFGTPEDVRRHVDALAAAFQPGEGGSWFYVEIDGGFPLTNVEALFQAVGRYR